MVVSAQCLSLVAFMLSWGWSLSFFVGLCAMIFQFILFCCVVYPGVLWGFVVTSLIAAGCNFYAGYAIMNTIGEGGIYYCSYMLSIENMCDNIRPFMAKYSYFGGALWTLIAILDVAYLLKKEEEEEDKTDDEVAPVAVPASEENDTKV